jgi:aquaporin Z
MTAPISSPPSDIASSDARVTQNLFAPANIRILVAEIVGTAVLMLVGPGSAILAAERIGVFGVALAFGFALLAMAYCIGHVSGCHINPAVTLGILFTKKITAVQAVFYWVAQYAGAAIGGSLIYAISKRGDLDQTGVFAANGWGNKINSAYGLDSTIVVEIVFTALLVFVVLSATTAGYPTGFGGLAAGLTLAMIHLVTIPVDNTSVNPARSFGAAVFAGSDAMSQLWAFIVFPLIGAVVGVMVWVLVHEEDTVFAPRQKPVVEGVDEPLQ